MAFPLHAARRVCRILLLILLFSRAAAATTFVVMEERQLVETSDAILVGTVTAIESGTPIAHGSLYTYVHIQPEYSLKGDVGHQALVVREPGGTFGQRREWIYGAPEFSVGERTLLFLVQNADGTLQTNNLAMGKFSVTSDSRGYTTATRNLGDGALVLRPADGTLIGARAEQQPFLRLLKRVRSTAATAHLRGRRPHTPVLQLIPRELSTATTEWHAAYTFINAPPVRWFEPDSGIPVNYFIDSTGDSALGFSGSQQAFDNALAAWTNVPTASIVLADGGTTPPAPLNNCDSPSRVVFDDPFNEIQNPSGCTGILAMGGYCGDGETTTVNGTTFNRITLGRVTVNDGWGPCPFWNVCNVGEVLTHEIGHTIGFGHSADSNATMAAVAHFDGRCAGVEQDDIDGLTFMYPIIGSPVPTATPTLTVPSTSTPTRTHTGTVTSTATVTRTPVPSATATTTPTRTSTATSSPTRTPTATPTATSTATPTGTRTDTPTATLTLTRTMTATQTATLTATETPTVTLTSTATATRTDTATSTPTPTRTNTPVQTPTATPSATRTVTQSSTPTLSATATSTRTDTPTVTPVPSATFTASPTATRTGTSTPTATVTATATATRTATRTATGTITPTPAPTGTPTQTPTSTATPAAGVSGRITYYSNGLPVSGATVGLGGALSTLTQTDHNGVFGFTNLGPGVFGVEPQMNGSENGAVSALDAVYALQSAVNLRTLSAAEVLACDVNGDGVVDALDATWLLQYTVGLIDHFPVADTCGSDWAFIPTPGPALNEQDVMPRVTGSGCQGGSISWVPLVGSVTQQDFSAVLFGDCTGNWQPAFPLVFPERAAQVRVGLLRTAGRQHSLRAPLSVQTGGTFQAVNAEIEYDASALSIVRVRRVGNAQHALVLTNTRVPGDLKLALASTEPLPAGTVLMLEFRAESPDVHTALRVTAAASE